MRPELAAATAARMKSVADQTSRRRLPRVAEKTEDQAIDAPGHV